VAARQVGRRGRSAIDWIVFAWTFEAAFPRGPRILLSMNQETSQRRLRRFFPVLRDVAVACAFFFAGSGVSAPEAQQGPLTPPPEHEVKRIGTEPVPEAPPSLPPEEIIRRFSQKEDEYLLARLRYNYRKTIRLEEFGRDGKPSGQLLLVTEPRLTSDGKVYEKTIERPQSTLQYLELGPEDYQNLARMPAYPLTTSQLAKYDLKYLGKELVDEIDCYIFQVKPKGVERAHAYFDGIVWVDAKYLEVVKTYGSWANDLGPVRSPTMPFALFETYRENVDGKYWFPSYIRSDDTLHLQDREVPVRLVIKWTDFKPLTAAATASAPPQPAAPPKPQP